MKTLLTPSPISERDQKTSVVVPGPLIDDLRALADLTRIGLLRLFIEQPGLYTVDRMSELFDKEQPTISHHLRILRQRGIADFKQRGLYHEYHADPARIKDICTLLLCTIFPRAKVEVIIDEVEWDSEVLI